MKNVEGTRPAWGWRRWLLRSAAATVVLTSVAWTAPFTQTAAAATIWPTFQHDISHTGRSAVDTTNVLGEVKWKFHTGASLETSPAVGSDGTVYLNSADGNLYAINPDGSQKWAFFIGGLGTNILNSSPAIGSDGTIYLGSDMGNVYAINPDGTEKWEFSTPSGRRLESSPVIGSDGTVYVGSDDRNLYAINPSDGSQKWALANAGGVSSPAIGSDGTIYSGSWDESMHAVNPDGTQVWAFATNGAIYSSPAIGSDGTIYFSSSDGNLYAVNPDGSQKWALAGGYQSSPAIGADGTIYVGLDVLSAVTDNGDHATVKWSFDTGSFVQSSPIIGADGAVYFSSIDSNLYAVNPDGTEKWALSLGGGQQISSAAITTDGTIYVGSVDTDLYAVNTVTSPKPLTVAPATLSFPNETFLNTGVTSITKTITVKNLQRGAVTVLITNISITGDFAIVSNGCAAPLPQGASCTLGVAFTPTGVGARTGSVTFEDNAVNSPQIVDLSGNGVAGKLTIFPRNMVFPKQEVSTTSAVRSAILYNFNTVPLHIGSVVPAGNFNVASDACSGNDIAPHGNCVIGVTFSPTQTGILTGQLTITDNAAASPQTITLSGTGILVSPTFSPPSLGFGRQTINISSAAKTLIVTNPNFVPLAMNSATVAGDFSIQSDGCSGTILGPSGTCSISVVFTPLATGPLVGSLTITDGAAKSPQTIHLSGLGAL